MTITFPKDIISKVLSPAVNLWLHSQLDQVQQLQVEITGANRQIISGYIPFVSLSCSHPVYQGIHLARVAIQGENIKINLGQVIKGQPLRLSEPILVTGEISLEESQLNLSLASPLLSGALTDLLRDFLSGTSLENYQIRWVNLEIKPDKLIMSGIANNDQTITLRTGLSLASPRKLLFHPLQIETATDHVSLSKYEVDLGSQVQLESLILTEGKINCSGKARITSD
ncbi:DUF2993 domain-containing protein [Gloeocapsa sp. PCC 73106]|uniref:LmeA family phospholipid-binding protein n=1 Tax=Gloeocapsa sp. PCC 73106 TaxID=102232 RepID=UPI0002ACD5D2|nr:DUF2993 domain-containing protein [Gloeocapsa sp. PCC 73106]ELR96716.1 Protein of unknown function (DUF2993) [Gloeocapsa sp. PCC 73106]